MRSRRNIVFFPLPAVLIATLLGACGDPKQKVGDARRPAAGEDIGQLSREDYAAAEKLLGRHLLKRVRNYFITPHWAGDSDYFWYKRELEEGYEFLLVNAATGEKKPVFDHREMARVVSGMSGKAITANHLPLAAFELNSGHDVVRFTVDDLTYECTVAGISCRTSPHVKPPDGLLLSPDKSNGVFVHEHNLWLRNVETGEERAVTTGGEADNGYGIYPDNRADFVKNQRGNRNLLPANTQWSPDGSFVLTALIDQRHVKTYPIVESSPEDGTFRPKVHQFRIPLVGERPADFIWYLINVASGDNYEIQLPYSELLIIHQDLLAVRDSWWSRDGNRLYLAAHGDNMESAHLFEVDAMTGKVRTVIEERLLPRTDLNSTSYNRVNVEVVNDGADVVWWSQRDGWGHLYLYDGNTGELINRITQGDWLVREIIHVDETGRIIYFTAGGSRGGNPYYRHLYRVNFDGSDLTLLSPEDADHLILPDKKWILSLDGISPHRVVSPSGKYAVYNYSRVDLPTRFVIRSVTDGKLIAEVEQANAGGLYEDGWRPPEEFTVKAADGKTELWGTMYKPSHFDPAKKYPVIDAQYASPLTAAVPRHFYQAFRGAVPLAPAAYAELGFIVVTIDARGTAYRSREFGHYSLGNLHTNGLEDHIAGIKELAVRHPFMDIDRVGITGHSYGGYTTIRAMIEFPGFFKAGIASGGPPDMHAMYNDYHWTAFHGRPRYRNGTQWMTDPTEVPENWENLNAVKKVERLQGKLLLQFAELDENVPPGGIFQFIDALIAGNKDFEMLYLPNRNHYFIDGYVMRRNWDFMVRNLLGKQPPQDYRIDMDRR